MMKRRIIAAKISITKQGELKFFQVKIPFDAIAIIGIETAYRMGNFKTFLSASIPQQALSAFSAPAFDPQVNFQNQEPDNNQMYVVVGDFGRNSSLVGELKLQSSDDSNVFYATNVLDHSAKERIDNVPMVNFTPERVWIHGYKREVEEVLVDGNTTVLAGLYKDRLGEMLKQNLSYEVFLYVWYEYKKQESHDSKSCS